MNSKRILILIGNGLGMAVDEKHFKLSTPFNDDNVLNSTERDFLSKYLRSDDDGKLIVDETKEDGERLYALQSYKLFLDTFHKINLDALLKPESNPKIDRDLLIKLNDIFKKIVFHFFDYQTNNSQLNTFFTNINSFIEDTYSEGNIIHVATLNYDKICYSQLLQILIDNPNPPLTDCFSGQKGQLLKFNRRIPDDKGLYMHLHGSPGIVTNLRTGDEHKLRTEETHQLYKNHRPPYAELKDSYLFCHFILNCVSRKQPDIARSNVLQFYNDCFKKALSEIDELYLIGYGGLDEHINDSISLFSKEGIIINIIEWEHAKHAKNSNFWPTQLQISNKNMNFKRLENILSFNIKNPNWDNC